MLIDLLGGETEEMMAAELDLDDVAAQSAKAVAELADLRTQLSILRTQIANAPRGVSDSADFDAMTWTFQIDNGCRVGGGHYALVRLTQTPNSKVSPPREAGNETPEA